MAAAEKPTHKHIKDGIKHTENSPAPSPDTSSPSGGGHFIERPEPPAPGPDDREAPDLF
jgi:hypothetical protein